MSFPRPLSVMLGRVVDMRTITPVYVSSLITLGMLCQRLIMADSGGSRIPQRGGEGNIHKEKEGKESLVDKVKDKIGVGHHKDGGK